MNTPEVPIFAKQRTDSPGVLEVSKEADFFNDDDKLFLLERRAIFSKSWICVAHRSRFIKPGDYASMELATFPIFIILGKDHVARAFHNVCRHRAYTVTRQVAGSTLVLSCKYHGWSYDTKGSLLKAPQFDGIDGFDKTQNSLFAVHTCTDKGGFIHVNLDAAATVSPPSCSNIVNFAADQGIDAHSRWITGWDIKGDFNWKVAAQQPISSLALQAPPPSPPVILLPGVLAYLRSLVAFPVDKRHATAGVATPAANTLNLAPITTIKAISGTPLFLALTAFPLSASRTSVRCDVYSKVSVVSLLAKGNSAPEAAQLAQLKDGVKQWVRSIAE